MKQTEVSYVVNSFEFYEILQVLTFLLQHVDFQSTRKPQPCTEYNNFQADSNAQKSDIHQASVSMRRVPSLSDLSDDGCLLGTFNAQLSVI